MGKGEVSKQDMRVAEIEGFALSHMPEIETRLQEMEGIESDLMQRIDDLERALSIVRREPSNDTDLLILRERLARVRKSKMKLWHGLENAYLCYVKFKTTPVSSKSEEDVTSPRQILFCNVSEQMEQQQRKSE